VNDTELAAQCAASKTQIDSTSITFQTWLERIQKGYKGKPYNYKDTGWYLGLNPLMQDKATADRVLLAAQAHLLETDTPDPPDPPDPPTPIGGLRPGVSFGGIGYGDAERAKRQRMIADAKAMGAKSIRVQWWGQTECDNAIQDIIDAGLQPYVTVMIEFATTKITETRAGEEGKMFADKWGDKVRHISFWNEPDLAGWDPEPWADCQVGFVKGVRSSSKGANFFIWCGDLWTWKMNSGSSTEGAYAWMVRAYARWKARGLTGSPGNGLCGHMYGDMRWNDPRNALFGWFGPAGDGKAQNCIRYLANQNGDSSKPIAATECGNNVPSAQPASVNSMFDLTGSGIMEAPLVYCQWDDAAGTFGMRPAEAQAARPAYSTYTSRVSGVYAAAAPPSGAQRLLAAVRPTRAPKSAYEISGDSHRS